MNDSSNSRRTRNAPRYFPPPWQARADWPLCFGDSLPTELLLDAYRHGIFPWPSDEYSPIGWWSPDPRAIIEWDLFHVPRRLARTIQSQRFSVTANRDFSGVIRGCAREHSRHGPTWISQRMIDAYELLHELNHAHSIEVWQNEHLVGGVYGVSIGGLFAAESMFHRARDASKVALVNLVTHLRARGFRLLDIQQWTSHTGQFGAIEIPRDEYLRRLAEVVDSPVTFGERLEGTAD